MIEMLGVLAIIGVLSAGGIMGYSAAMTNYRINKIITDFSLMTVNAKSIFTKNPTNTRSYFWGNALYQLGILPSDYYKSISGACSNRESCFMKSPLGHRMEVYLGMGTTNSTTFVMKNGTNTKGTGQLIWLAMWIYGVTKGQCVKLATHNWDNAFGYTFGQFGYSGFTDYELPMSMSEAEEKCTELSSNPTDSKSRFSIFACQGNFIQE